MEHIKASLLRPSVKRAITVEQAASSAHHAIDQLSEVGHPAVSRATAGAHHLVDRISGTTNRVARRLEHAATRLKDAEQHLVGVSSGYVRDHPLKTVGVALAVVFLVSWVAGSRHQAARHSDREALAESAEGATAAARKR